MRRARRRHYSECAGTSDRDRRFHPRRQSPPLRAACRTPRKFFALRQRACARFTHRQQSRHRRAPCRSEWRPPHFAGGFRYRVKQQVDGRAVAVNRRQIVQLCMVVGAAARQLKMTAARRDIGVSRQYAIAVLRLFYGDLADLVQTIGKRSGKPGGHMLGNHNARTVQRHRGQHLTQRFGAAGRGADSDNFSLPTSGPLLTWATGAAV